jgi:hypothetical protein
MNEMIMHEAMQRAAFDQPATTPAARSARIIHTPRGCGAVRAIVQPTTRQLPADRAGRAAKKATNALLAIASVMLGENHATFLAAEVLASSVHRNILCPVGSGCCT